jgi:hypothetical protein
MLKERKPMVDEAFGPAPVQGLMVEASTAACHTAD